MLTMFLIKLCFRLISPRKILFSYYSYLHFLAQFFYLFLNYKNHLPLKTRTAMKPYLRSLHSHFAKKSLTEWQWFGKVIIIIQMSFEEARCMRSWPAQGKEGWVKGKKKMAFTAKLQYSQAFLQLYQHFTRPLSLSLIFCTTKLRKG